MLVNYDDSSSSENEEESKQTVQPVTTTTNDKKPIIKINNLQKPKIKLPGPSASMQRAHDTISSSNYSMSDQIEEEEEEQHGFQHQTSNFVSNLNKKRKLPSNIEDEIKCPVEPKYHKLNEKAEDIQNKQKQYSSNEQVTTKQSTEVKTKPKRTLFVPPQARGRANITTEY